MDTISGGFQSDLTAQEVLLKLSNATQPTQVPLGSARVYGGDLVIAVDILVKISEYDREKVSSRDDFDNFAHVASNLLETTNSKTWKELEEVSISHRLDFSHSLVSSLFPQAKTHFRSSSHKFEPSLTKICHCIGWLGG